MLESVSIAIPQRWPGNQLLLCRSIEADWKDTLSGKGELEDFETKLGGER